MKRLYPAGRDLRVAELALDMVRQDSVYSGSNLGIANLVNQVLYELGGFSVINYNRYDEETGKYGNINIVATIGNGKGGLTLLGHTDTVPIGNGWTRNPAGEIRDGKIYGRGAVDMKSALAAFLVAAGRINRRKIRRPLKLIFTECEEYRHKGVRYLIKEGILSGHEYTHVIVGEPTGLTPVIFHPGIAETEVTIYGKSAHGGSPHLGVNAIEIGAIAITELERLKVELMRTKHRVFQEIYIALNLAGTENNNPRNVVPDKNRLVWQYRHFPPLDGDYIHRVIVDRLQGLVTSEGKKGKGKLLFHAEQVRNDAHFEISRDDELVRFLEKITRKQAGAFPGSTEALDLQQAGVPHVVICGPGELRQAHQPDEHNEIPDLESAVRIYSAAIARFCY